MIEAIDSLLTMHGIIDRATLTSRVGTCILAGGLLTRINNFYTTVSFAY